MTDRHLIIPPALHPLVVRCRSGRAYGRIGGDRAPRGTICAAWDNLRQVLEEGGPNWHTPVCW